MRRSGAGSRPPGKMPRGHPSPVGAERPHPQRYAGLLRGRSSLAAASRPPPLFAHSASALAPGLCPCARPLRRGPPGPRFAAPVRRIAPALASLGCRGRPSARPPGSLARPLCGLASLRPPRALAGPAALGVGLPSLRASFASLRSPLLRVGLPAALRVAPPGPPCAARFAASGPGASAPGACAALRAACFGLRPPGLLCSPRLRGCAGISVPGCQVQASGPLRGPDLTARPGYAVG